MGRKGRKMWKKRRLGRREEQKRWLRILGSEYCKGRIGRGRRRRWNRTEDKEEEEEENGRRGKGR